MNLHYIHMLMWLWLMYIIYNARYHGKYLYNHVHMNINEGINQAANVQTLMCMSINLFNQVYVYCIIFVYNQL